MKPIALDLGLSVRWADRDLGAEKPDQFGSYFCHNKDLSSGAEQTAFFNSLIKKEIGKKWRLPTIEEVLELERCSWQEVTHRVSDGKYAWWEGANKVISPNKTCLYLHTRILVSGLAFFSFSGINDKPGIFITDPNRRSPLHPDGLEYYSCFYQYSSHYGEHDKGTSLTTGVYIRPVTDDWPSLSDRFRKLSEEDFFKDYQPNPQKPIPLSIERIDEITEEQFWQHQEALREEREWHKQYWARIQAEEEEKKKQALMTGKVYHKVRFFVNYWKRNSYEPRKDFIIDTRLIRHDELMAVISGGMSARKAWFASHSNLYFEDIFDVDISYNLGSAYDKDGNLLSDDY